MILCQRQCSALRQCRLCDCWFCFIEWNCECKQLEKCGIKLIKFQSILGSCSYEDYQEGR